MPRDKDLDEEEDAELLKIRMNRRRALSTSAKIGVAAGVAAVVAGVGGYFGGVASAPAAAPTTITSTETITRTIEKTAEKTVTETVSPGVVTRTETMMTTQTITVTPTAGPPKYKFVLCNHVSGWVGWKPAVRGCQDAARQVNAEVVWTGPVEYDIPKYVEMLESIIQAKPDGMGLCLVDPAINEVGWKAMNKGIPVMCFNDEDRATPEPDRGRLGFVGQDLELSGYMMGTYMCKKLPGHPASGKIKPGDLVCIVSCIPGQAAHEARARGLIRAFEEYGAKYERIAGAGADAAKAADIMEAYYRGHPEVKGFCTTGGGTPMGMGPMVERLGIKGQLSMVGYDPCPPTLDAVKAGLMDMIVDQQFYFQGYYPVVALWEHLESGRVSLPANVDTRAFYIDSGNIDAFIAYTEKITAGV